MEYVQKDVSKTVRILFPIIVTVIAGLVSPNSVALVGFLMFGNLIRECGVLDSLSETAQKVLANLVTSLLGLTIAARMNYEAFLTWQTIMILLLGLIAFIFDYDRRRFVCKINQSLLQEKNQSDDWCCRHLCFPDVIQSHS